MTISGFAPGARRSTSAERASPSSRLRHEIALQRRGIGDRRRQSDAAMAGRQAAQPREAQRQKIAALANCAIACNSSSTTARRLSNRRRASRDGEQQRELFGRGQQNIGRRCAVGAAGATAGVSPVRVSMRMGRPISATGVSRLRATSTASAFSGEI